MTLCAQSRNTDIGIAHPSDRLERIEFSYAKGPTPTLVFDAESVTSDGGLAGICELDVRLGLTMIAADHIDDTRNQELTVHPILRLIREAAYAYVAGYEDANDHPMLAGDALFVGMLGPTNQKSVNPKRHDGLASEASLSRLLYGRSLGFDRFACVHPKVFARIVENNPPKEITLDIDGYDAETHGAQQMSLFSGYYEKVVYYPLLVTVAEYGVAVGALLRPGNAGSAEDAVPLLDEIITTLKCLLPNTRVKLRADSGFMDPKIYRLLEKHHVRYAIRLRMNKVLERYFEEAFPDAEEIQASRGRDKRWALYHRRDYKAGSWKKARRIIMKLQNNPDTGKLERYVIVTNVRRSNRRVWRFYEHRGQCEQRNDELKNHLRGEKFSCNGFDANAMKLHLIVMAHNLLAAVRVMLPARHELKRATIERLRTTLIKCGASVVRTARRLWIHASSSWPNRRFLLDVARRFTSQRLVARPLWESC